MQTIFPEQNTENPNFWKAVYDGTKGDNFHTVLRMQVNQLFADLYMCQTDIQRAQVQGRAMELRTLLDLPDIAVREVSRIIQTKKAQETPQEAPGENP